MSNYPDGMNWKALDGLTEQQERNNEAAETVQRAIDNMYAKVMAVVSAELNKLSPFSDEQINDIMERFSETIGDEFHDLIGDMMDAEGFEQENDGLPAEEYVNAFGRDVPWNKPVKLVKIQMHRLNDLGIGGV